MTICYIRRLTEKYPDEYKGNEYKHFYPCYFYIRWLIEEYIGRVAFIYVS
jgi:hypothetical protein